MTKIVIVLALVTIRDVPDATTKNINHHVIYHNIFNFHHHNKNICQSVKIVHSTSNNTEITVYQNRPYQTNNSECMYDLKIELDILLDKSFRMVGVRLEVP